MSCGKSRANSDIESLEYFGVGDEHYYNGEEEDWDLHEEVVVHPQLRVVFVRADAQKCLVFPSAHALEAEKIDLNERNQEGEE